MENFINVVLILGTREEYYKLIKDEIPKAHLHQLKQLGIEKKYLADWDKLIKRRYAEYSRDKFEVRKAAMLVESKEKDLDTKDILNIQMVLPVNTVSIGCHHHICRGKTEGKDELFKLTLKWLVRFYIEIRVPLEGGKITPLKRMWVKLKHFLR